MEAQDERAGAQITDTCQVVTSAGVLEINFRNHTVKLVHPEKDPDRYVAANALAAAIATWFNTKDAKELEELRVQVERLIVSSAETVLKAKSRN